MKECPLRFVPLRQKDRNLWESHWRGYSDDDPPMTESGHMDRLWKRILNPHSALFGWYALDEEGQPCGFVHCAAQEVTYTHRPVWYLNDLYVVPEKRGRGYARALIRYVAHEARTARVPELYWVTRDNNYRAQRLYDRMGADKSWIRYTTDPAKNHL
jgi:ribosomal protein S18 acetylase RimI-like enzyme